MGPPKSYTFDFKGKITAKIFLWFRHLSASFGRLKHFKAAGSVFDLRLQSTVTKRFQLETRRDVRFESALRQISTSTSSLSAD
jgi:hypothetical protein